MKIKLKPTDKENLYIGKRSDGTDYSVRGDRKRYFFPTEWEQFYNSLTSQKQRLFFLICIHTGARAMEILNLRAMDFNYERKSITFSTTKQRKAKKNFYATGKTRTFFISDNLLKEVKKYVTKNKLQQNEYLFLDNKKIPKEYPNLSNEEKKKYWQSAFVSFSKTLKSKLKNIGIEDYYNFSLHNLRKTYGNWMRVFDIRTEEICYRLGHDIDTYYVHYGSPLIFTEIERRKIMKIMGEVQ